MKPLVTAALAACALAPFGFADGREPGSVLVYPIHRSGLGAQPTAASASYFTVLCVTNKNLTPANPNSFGGSTNVHFQYVNTFPDPLKPFKPQHCLIVDRTEFLTPADTLCVLTSCHNAAGGQEGYVVVSAQDPTKFKTNWSWNHLMGSELVITDHGSVYSLNAIPFSSPLPEGDETDVDFDGQIDFDGIEYEGIPETLYIDSFMAVADASLILINLTGGTDFVATVQFDVWNDNEFPLSATLQFKCWFEEKLRDVSLVFSDTFLAQNTPNDPEELDIDCDGDDDVETGWAMINGLVASSSVESVQNPALLGAITAGGQRFFDGGRLLWESSDKQFNGDFLNFGSDDPEN